MDARDLGFDPDRLDRIGDLCRRFVDSGRLPCASVAVVRGDEVAHRVRHGWADVERARPVADDTIFRIYSMTKPLTSLALLQLVEQGLVLLENPVARYVPELADVEVWVDGDETSWRTRPVDRPMTVHDVLRHTAGLTYGFVNGHPVDALYRRRDLGNFTLPAFDLAEGMARLGEVPLLYSPGDRWSYSMATDVCGRIVEVVSGRSLSGYLAEHVLGPLGMVDTGFFVPESGWPRLAANYVVGPRGLVLLDDPERSPYRRPPAFESGGGGLVSTMADYVRFCRCLLRGGELDGARIIGRRTLEWAALNHLPGGRTLNELEQTTFSESAMEGMGFGLGFSVVLDPAANASVCSPGELAWGGAASTAFWVDPVEDLAVVFLTQQMPSNHYPIRRLLRAVVYQALT